MNAFNSKKLLKTGLALALIATLGLTQAQADSLNDGAEQAVSQQTLIDWGHKTRIALNKKLDDKLTEQLMQQNESVRMASTWTQGYQTANLVLAGQTLSHSNLAPLSSIPVVIIQNRQSDCLFNL